VFEFVSDDIGAQGTVCGGGRYDGLIGELGGAPAPAVGFAAGIERLLLVMESTGVKIPEEEKPLVYFAGMDAECRKKAFALTIALRHAGIYADLTIIIHSPFFFLKYSAALEKSTFSLSEEAMHLTFMAPSCNSFPPMTGQQPRLCPRERFDGVCGKKYLRTERAAAFEEAALFSKSSEKIRETVFRKRKKRISQRRKDFADIRRSKTINTGGRDFMEKQDEFEKLLGRQKEFFASGVTLDPAYRISALKALYRAIRESEEALCRALKADLGKRGVRKLYVRGGAHDVRNLLPHSPYKKIFQG